MSQCTVEDRTDMQRQLSSMKMKIKNLIDIYNRMINDNSIVRVQNIKSLETQLQDVCKLETDISNGVYDCYESIAFFELIHDLVNRFGSSWLSFAYWSTLSEAHTAVCLDAIKNELSK